MCTKEEVKEVIKEAGLVKKGDCLKTSNVVKTQVKLMKKDIKQIQKDLSGYIKADMQWKESFKDDLENNYVNKLEFEPVKKVVYTVVGIVITSVVTALIALIIKY